MKRRLFSLISVGLILLASCNLPGGDVTPVEENNNPATQTLSPVTEAPVLDTVIPATVTASPVPSKGTFTLSILVDMDSQPVTREQAQTLVDEANSILMRLTGFNFEMVDFRETSGSVNSILQTYFADPAYIRSDGIIIFSYGNNGDAKLYGGYGFAERGPAGFESRFKSPYVDDNSIYIGVIHYGHRYSVCGYDGNDAPISSVSIGGECRGQTGTACVEKFGYQMCSTAIDDLYASTLTYMSSATFVHEMMHSFGDLRNMDHYFTAECTEKMKTWTTNRPYQSEFFDRTEGSSYVQMCPYVYDVFVNSYEP